MNPKTILVDAVDCFVSKEGVIDEDMRNMLDGFPNRKILVTGANDEQFAKWGLDKMPYEVFTLKHNPEKIDPRYFEILLEKFSLKASDVVYFEHNPAAVESARTAGIESYYYDEKVWDLEGLRGFIKLTKKYE